MNPLIGHRHTACLEGRSRSTPAVPLLPPGPWRAEAWHGVALRACLYSLFQRVAAVERKNPNASRFFRGFSTKHPFQLKHGYSETTRPSKAKPNRPESSEVGSRSTWLETMPHPVRSISTRRPSEQVVRPDRTGFSSG
jgi:hypothetical protein